MKIAKFPEKPVVTPSENRSESIFLTEHQTTAQTPLFSSPVQRTCD
jgi:hypothetical protein